MIENLVIGTASGWLERLVRPMRRHHKIAFVLLFIAFCGTSRAQQPQMETQALGKVIEILTIDVKPGKRDQFHKIYQSQALPLLRKWKFDVVAYGPSLHDANSYYVGNAFIHVSPSLSDMAKGSRDLAVAW